MSKQQIRSSTMVRLICPSCHSSLESFGAGVQCSRCHQVFPVLGSVLCFSQAGRAAWDDNTTHQFGFYDDRYADFAQASGSVFEQDTLVALHVHTFKMAQVDALMSSFQLRKDSRVLEVGCGHGWFLRWLNNRYHAQGIGVDISPAAVNLAAVNDWAGNEYYAAEATQLPFETASFDLVCALDVIEHLTHEQKRNALREMVRVLKPGGNVLLYTLHVDDKYTDFWFKRTWARLRGGERAICERERIAYEEEGGHLRSNFISVQAMQVLAQESGLADVQVLPFHAICTSIYDLYVTQFVIIPIMNLINRAARAWRARNSPVISPQVSPPAPIAPRWKVTFVKVYQPVFAAMMKLFCTMDRPLIARGHFAGMFVVGQKRAQK
ncbi:MAG: methyltransferase domain-containing protein [Chloroflexi bacterium]|nr:methyltransferase domain-containing protein [Chloroflexota bacterium]